MGVINQKKLLEETLASVDAGFSQKWSLKNYNSCYNKRTTKHINVGDKFNSVEISYDKVQEGWKITMGDIIQLEMFMQDCQDQTSE